MPIEGPGAGYIPPTTLSGLPPQAELGATQPTQVREIDGNLSDRLAADLNAFLRGGSNCAAEIPPPGAQSNDDLSEVGKNLAMLGGDQVTADIYSFMALFQKLAQSMRDTARTQRTGEMQAQVSALQGAADQMREAAAARFSAAVVQGSMQIAGGVATIGMSVASAASSIKGAKLDAQGKDMLSAVQNDPGASGAWKQNMSTTGNSFIASGARYTAVGQGMQSSAQGAGSMLGGVGTIAASFSERQAGLADAARTDLETEAKVHETAVGHANEMMQQMMDVIRDVRDKLQSIQQAAIETNRGIARNI